QSREQSRHLDKRMIFDLCSHAEIIDRIASLMGPDLLLWRSHLFNKEPGGKAVPWHQDVNYWPIEPLINISAWIAIDEVTAENSCVQLIPESHKKMIPHIASSDEMEFVEMADPSQIDASKAIKMELQPGQFFLFTDRLLHYSDPNRSSKRRMGFSLRVTVPWVRIDHEALFTGHRAILLRGEDRFGFNRLTEPPAS
ncbi:MAG: phytanoyl-CoA dioxygenase family protein, partial [Opitutaceae bacterium]|nr:phytanoyl-CoA dioxygenase family protein [Opitutaceae bacterium]